MRSVTIGKKAIAASTTLYTGRGVLRRVSVRENTGTATATFELWDGVDTTGQLIDPYTLLANESARDQFWHDEHPITAGLYVNIQSGTIDLVVTIVALTPTEIYALGVEVLKPVNVVPPAAIGI